MSNRTGLETNDILFETLLRSCLPEKPGFAVIHSSLIHIRPPKHIGEWDILSSIRRLVNEGWTFAFPSFTFSFCEGRPFHLLHSRSETGVLADWARQLSGFHRTKHPIYSFVVGGPMYKYLLDCKNSTTFGDDSSFCLFEKLDATLVMLGCDWTNCTQFHRYEEEAQVPFRYYKIFRGTVDFMESPKKLSVKMYVRNKEIRVKNDFSKCIDMFRSKKSFRCFSLWAGNVESISCRDFAEVVRGEIKESPWNVVENGKRMEYSWGCHQEKKNRPPVKIAIFSETNSEMLKSACLKYFKHFVDDRNIEIFTPPYGQTKQQVLDFSSSLYTFAPDFSVFIDRLENLIGMESISPEMSDKISNAVEVYCDTILAFRKSSSGIIIVCYFAEFMPNPNAVVDSLSEEGCPKLINNMNTLMKQRIGDLDDVYFFDLQAAGSQAEGFAIDDRLWYLGRFPFSDKFSAYLAKRFVGMYLSLTGRTARLIILDLDNTLWSGILGEDGAAGICLSGDYPGNAFSAFQMACKRLTDRGLALALCSKNDEKHVLETINSLPDMILREEDFVAVRINWEPKWINVMELSESFGIGLSNVLFIDDNAAEREQMRQFLPSVRVLDLPKDPSLYQRTLLESPFLVSLKLTEEDRRRVESYKRSNQIAALKASCKDLKQFYRSLNLKMYVSPLREDNLNRAEQLLQKTNQFNTTTRRYSLSELRSFVSCGHSVFIIGAEDRYNPFENVGVIIVMWKSSENYVAVIDEYLLSCRVLGRGLETAVLAWLASYAKTLGYKSIIGEIVETKRNIPVRTVFSDSGFEAYGKEKWILKLEQWKEKLPDWVTVIDDNVSK